MKKDEENAPAKKKTARRKTARPQLNLVESDLFLISYNLNSYRLQGIVQL